MVERMGTTLGHGDFWLPSPWTVICEAVNYLSECPKEIQTCVSNSGDSYHSVPGTVLAV